MLALVFGLIPANAQQVNGQALNFPKGKADWSDTVYKQLQTKKMAKEGIHAVPMTIRYKFIKKLDDGLIYQIEFTNKSHETPVKFNVTSNHRMDVFTIKLKPGQSKVVEKKYWRKVIPGSTDDRGEDGEFMIPPLEEILEKGN